MTAKERFNNWIITELKEFNEQSSVKTFKEFMNKKYSK